MLFKSVAFSLFFALISLVSPQLAQSQTQSKPKSLVCNLSYEALLLTPDDPDDSAQRRRPEIAGSEVSAPLDPEGTASVQLDKRGLGYTYDVTLRWGYQLHASLKDKSTGVETRFRGTMLIGKPYHWAELTLPARGTYQGLETSEVILACYAK